MPPPERIALARCAAPDVRGKAAARAAEVLRGGGIALLPAEGVYGLHALPSRPEGVARLLSIKPPGTRSGWIGLLARPEDLDSLAAAVPESARKLIRAHWPGALTLVLDASASVPPPLRAPDGTVALRCPGSELLRAVVAASGETVLSTSANRPGTPPALCAEDAPPAWADLILDVGPLSGIPSTIVRVTGESVRLIRAGGVSIPGGAP